MIEPMLKHRIAVRTRRVAAGVCWSLALVALATGRSAAAPAKKVAKGNATAKTEDKPSASSAPARTASGADAAHRNAGKSGKARKARGQEAPAAPVEYTSKNFLLHTDLSPAAAEELLDRLETMIELISKYWGRPLSGTIECHVVNDVDKWKGVEFEPTGLASITSGAGVTVGRTISQGDAFIARAVVYAVADRGTPQHEAVHAYCIQTFGRTGPVWYSEGMAEMGQYWRDKDPAVHAHAAVIDYLHSAEPKPLNDIVNGRELSGDSWQNYAWRWALCHLLSNNTNYATRFRPLGMGLLTRADVSFEQIYGDMAREINFEYGLFLQQLDEGYRADLCSWDWSARWKKVRTSATTAAAIDAGHGWQPSKLTLVKGDEYEYSATGKWSIGPGGGSVSADGGDNAAGQLVGVVFDDYELGEPFALGTYGSFTAPADGDLFLRCQDKWTELADNKGKISVRLKLKDKGPPLPPPKDKAESEKQSP